ncbi:uncharacterized protein C11orf52 homolog isoform X2 [Erinaceus europaeus]|uniref:Uncharacterized protein C11orf52 homolog isoform X2 n=1 Tax=Erinaceus europaeus TaxID=9365 RepID=A0ABM3WHN7_ERIEU|nr:uncharacterized protein C11orf52 homolog isoform X2 [Erinaceus europaeus]
MGNQLCHGRNRSCPSIFRRKKKTGNQARGTAKKQQEQQNGTKAHDNTEHTYERVLKQPVSQKRSQSCRSEESDLHYADIQVYSQSQLHSAWRAKPLKLENTTEYATLRFPLATPHQNSKKGTLV